MCTDDIQLMIPFHDIVSGIPAFLSAEQTLFRGSRFTRFHKRPCQIEKQGNMVVETGKQWVEVINLDTSDKNHKGVLAHEQKYTHVFPENLPGVEVCRVNVQCECTMMSDLSVNEDFETHRNTLERLAYRMLGTLSEAQDAVQETYIKWHTQDRDNIITPRAWLMTVCTRVCLNHLKSAYKQMGSLCGPMVS